MLVLVDGYAKSQRPTALYAVHFSLDDERAARLRDAWLVTHHALPSAAGHYVVPVAIGPATGPATRIQPAGQGMVLNWRITDTTGDLTALFYGRTSIAGAGPGSQIRLHGMVGIGSGGHPAMINPGYELVR